MTLADRLVRQLESIREMTDKMLAAFQSPEDWVYQAVPYTNHALWFAGHMATTDNYFISRIAPERALKLDHWDKLFSMGSKPTGDPDDYPPAAEVVDAMRERREVLLELLRGRPDAEMTAPPAGGASEYWPDMGSIFEMATWHETLHLGQVTIARRALGHRPLFDPAPAEAAAS
jgi:uncharacterized damage-inducible protein DinB